MRIVLYLLYVFTWLLMAKSAFAQEVLFKDNFDDGDTTNWTVQRNAQWAHPDQPCLNGGQPATWNTKDGEFGITINGGPSCTTTITPNLDLTAINSFSFTFDWHFLESIYMDRNVALLWQDEHNWYGIKVLGTEVRLEKMVDGRLWSLPSNWGSYNFEPNQRYHFSLTISNNNAITITINGSEVLKTEDQVPFIRGFKTVGLMASTGAIRYSVSYFDNVEVRSLENSAETNLHVPLIKQSDPSWRDTIYDKATLWSTKPTIGRWGCALTSMAMILQYHGIDHLPNNTIVTPYSLNAWLNDQPDGFIGEGAINWMAITRLTHQLSNQLQTPKLEYRWQNFDKELIKSEINKKQPVIVNIPGHFLVADGYTTNSDLIIKDPAYSYDKLSQHSSTPTSIRTFKPSQTDLSYLMIVHQPPTKVSIIDHHTESYTEHLTDQTDGSKTTELAFTVLAQPSSGDFRINVVPSTAGEAVTIYTYTQRGDVTIHRQTISEPTTFLLHFSLTNPSTIETTPSTLRELLKELYDQTQIYNRYVFLQLNRLASYAETYQENRTRYYALLDKKITQFAPYISANAQMALREKMI